MLDFIPLDLTHTLSSETPSWDGGCGFSLSVKTDYADCKSTDVKFRIQEIQSRAGMGTHMDAPAHCISGGKTIEMLDLRELVSDCVVIKVDHEVDENYVIMPTAVEQFEKENGEIHPGTFVVFRTGWDQYWDTPEKYVNNHQFPRLDKSTAELLLMRNISGLGTDTLSADTEKSGFPVHDLVLTAGKYLVENIAHSDMLPITGSKIMVLPMKIKDGTEAPIRLVALIPNK
jgi:kynurenine formamidase